MSQFVAGVALVVVMSLLLLASGLDRFWLIAASMLCGFAHAYVMQWLLWEDE